MNRDGVAWQPGTCVTITQSSLTDRHQPPGQAEKRKQESGQPGMRYRVFNDRRSL